MGDRADPLRAVRVHQYAFVAKPRTEGGGGAEFRVDFENYDVGVDTIGIEFQAGRRANRFR